MHSTRKGSSKRSEEALDDDSDDRDSKRKSRNLSEKKRRDQFNMLVNELNSMISSGSRKMDKSTVLKSTISYLKNHNEIAVRSRVNEIQESWKPTFLSNEEFAHLVLEAVDGFIIACSTYGKIYYVSETVTSLLGHLPKNIIQKSIYDFTFEEDHKNIYSVLLNTKEHKEHASFLCHVQRGDHESKMSNFYELVRFSGYVRFVDDPLTNSSTNSCNDFNDRYVFVGTVRLERPQLLREIPLVDSSKSEFTSRHSLEWKFLFLDPRAPPIIGYLPFELLGTSGFDYYHIDDLEKVTKCHESLMQKGEGTSCYYRFLTKGQQWIWLQTRFYISYHQWNSKPEFIVCTHRVVNFVDVNDANLKKENGQDYISSDSFRSSFKQEKSAKSVLLSGPESEGTSISADSLTSKNSTNTQQSKKSNCGPQPSNIQEYSNPQEQSQVSYDNTAPVKRTLSVPTAVISPPKQNVENDSTQTQLQADLQRKHAELQVIIDQQQAELRRVSEQLLMARLGLLSTGNETNSNLESITPTSNSETVTSTNGILMEPSTTPSIASLNVSNQPDSIFSSADSNTSPKPN